MSALGHKRAFEGLFAMSALPPKVDIVHHGRDVRFVPIRDMRKKEPQERNALGVRSLTERLGCRGDGGRRPDRVSLIAEQPTKPN
jgi:hypothetical protein